MDEREKEKSPTESRAMNSVSNSHRPLPLFFLSPTPLFTLSPVTPSFIVGGVSFRDSLSTPPTNRRPLLVSL